MQNSLKSAFLITSFCFFFVSPNASDLKPLPSNISSCDKINFSYDMVLFGAETENLIKGIYKPNDCIAKEAIAILVPYRNRATHLRIFVNYMNDFLIRQRRHFAIFFIEPIPQQRFNRGKLLNVGFEIASKMQNFTCYFLHDVDLLPLEIKRTYICPKVGTAKHWSSAIDKYGFQMPYASYLGGVTAVHSSDYKKINGFSNLFWGWGGEDDNFYERTVEKRISIIRENEPVAPFTMLRHQINESGNEINECRYVILSEASAFYDFDGLSNLDYDIVKINTHKSFIHILVDLKEPKYRRVCRDNNNFREICFAAVVICSIFILICRGFLMRKFKPLTKCISRMHCLNCCIFVKS